MVYRYLYQLCGKDQLIGVVLSVGTNDLATRGVNPEDLIDNLDKSATHLKRFDNVQHVFLGKIPSRFDSHSINPIPHGVFWITHTWGRGRFYPPITQPFQKVWI